MVNGLQSGADGGRPAPDALVPVVYDELRRLANRYMAGERVGHTLQPTALVHQAYVRLADTPGVEWEGRTHFFAVAARAMRRVLIDHARERDALKRGGGDRPLRVTFVEGLPDATEVEREGLIALHRALERLAGLDPRQAKIVELRYFAGLTVAEVAEHLGVSKRTVEGDWAHARAWLRHELAEAGTP